MLIVSFSSIVFPNLSLLFLIVLIDGLKWNKDWAFGCDFKSINDFTHMKTRAQDCAIKCASTTYCTHYTWTNFQGGTCWMKKGLVKKIDATEDDDKTKRCGVIINNPLDAKEASIGFIDMEAFKCIFRTIDPGLQKRHFMGLEASLWKPKTKEEAAVYLTHVYMVTSGLKQIRAYCRPTSPSGYDSSWNQDSLHQNFLYTGADWFQLTWPCNNDKSLRSLVENPLMIADDEEHGSELEMTTPSWFNATKDTSGEIQERVLSTTILAPNETRKRAFVLDESSPIFNQVDIYRRASKCLKLGQKFE